MFCMYVCMKEKTTCKVQTSLGCYIFSKSYRWPTAFRLWFFQSVFFLVVFFKSVPDLRNYLRNYAALRAYLKPSQNVWIDKKNKCAQVAHLHQHGPRSPSHLLPSRLWLLVSLCLFVLLSFCFFCLIVFLSVCLVSVRLVVLLSFDLNFHFIRFSPILWFNFTHY